MIDLREKGLPSTVDVGGSFFNIKTDFREWLKFEQLIKNKECKLGDLAYLFIDDVPLCDYSKSLLEFYINDNATPNSDETSDIKTVDFILDGEYIVGSFMQAYNIDLTSVDMHWHMFKALFLSLNDDSKIKQIMGFRSYKKQKTTYEEQAEKNKKAWQFPRVSSKEDKQLLDDINDLFYNC